MSVIAVMVNCALVGFSGLADRLWPDMTTTERIVFIVILEVCESRVHIITPHKRSLGQGNVFIPVCYPVHRERVGFPACITGHMTRGLHLGGLPPGSWAEPPPGLSTGGVCIQGGLADPLPQDTWDTTRYGQQAGGRHPTGMLCCSFPVKISNCIYYLLLPKKVHLTFPSQYIVLLR